MPESTASPHQWTDRDVILTAERFTAILRASMTPEQWAEVCAINARDRLSGACASQDYCDANEVMSDAIAATFPILPQPEPGPEEEAYDDLWDRAWTVARALWPATSPTPTLGA